MSSQPSAHDPLTDLLNGRPPDVVPVAPVYEGLGPLQFHRMELSWRKWRGRLDRAGADLLSIDYDTYLEVELEIHTDILDHWYPPPTWLGLPSNSSPDDIAGCAVARRGDDLFWIFPDGGESWMPPDRAAYHESQTAERTMPYADLWDRGHHADALQEVLAEAQQSLDTAPEPTPQEAEALSASRRYDIARALRRRYPGLPFYYYGMSPYNTLLGLLGFQGMMSSLAEQPDLVHEILSSRLPRPSARLEAARRLGVGIIFMEECLASADLISPRMYQEFVFPYTKQALQFYEDRGFRTVLYFSGNLMPLLKHLKELPWTALSFEEDRKNYGIDLAEVRRALGPDRILFGNLDAYFVETASDEEVLAEVRRHIEVAGADGNFVVSIGSPFTPDTALQRVRLVCESTRML